MDEDIIKKLRDCMGGYASGCPKLDLTLEENTSFRSAGILAFVGDDIMDSLDVNTEDYNVVKKSPKMMNDIYTGVYKSADELPCPLESFIPLKDLQWKFYKESSKEIPEFSSRNKDFVNEFMNSVRGGLLAKGVQIESGVVNHSPFSSNMTRILKALETGFLAPIEYIALHENVHVVDEVRRDILFQHMAMSSRIISSTMNEILGLGRDIKYEQVKESILLTNVVTTGISLQTAFDMSVNAYLDAVKDFKVTAKLLKESYEDDSNVRKYIGILEHGIDGQLHWYTKSTRYGNTKFKIVN